MFTQGLTRFAEHLATPLGFLWTQGAGVVFGLAGFLFHFSEGWQLAYTLFLSIATFLIGGVILVAQNHDEKAIQKKLDELLRAIPQARNDMIGIEDRSPD